MSAISVGTKGYHILIESEAVNESTGIVVSAIARVSPVKGSRPGRCEREEVCRFLFVSEIVSAREGREFHPRELCVVFRT